MCTRVHKHFICKRHCIGDLILKWKSLKWNSVCWWKQQFLVEVHIVFMPCHIRQLQGHATTYSADTVQNACQHWGWKVLQYLSYSSQLLPCDKDLFPKLKHLLRATICWQRGYFNISSVQCGTGEHVRWCWWCSPPSPLLTTNHRQPQALRLRFLGICTSSLCCILCFMFALNATVKQTSIQKLCALLASYQWLLYIQFPALATFASTCLMLWYIYSTSYIATSLAIKKFAVTLWSDPHIF